MSHNTKIAANLQSNVDSSANRKLTTKIGYLAQLFPGLTITFVYREILALRAVGLQLESFSIWKPNPDELSEEAKGFVEETFYVFPLNWFQFVHSHIYYLFSRPKLYLGTLWFCLTREHTSFKNRVRTFYHFCQAVYMGKTVERKQIQHLHAHFALNATTIALVISRLSGVTFSFTAHADDIFVNPILLPEKIKAALFIVVISEYNARFLYDVVPAPETLNKMYLVHCGIDVKRFSPNSQQPSVFPPTILAVGQLVEKKGYAYLIKACKILVGRGYDFRCLIAGGGPQEALLTHMIEEAKLSNHVHLVGRVFQEQLPDYYRQADIFVLACVRSHNQSMDGIPNVLMEAMAMEIPCISTTISGIPELVEHGKTGLLVPPQDEVSLADAIATLLEDPELRTTLGKAGRAKVIADFEIEKSADTLIQIFRSYLG